MRSGAHTCRLCGLSVRHADDLRRHEERCAARRDATPSGSGSSTATANGYPRAPPLKKRLLAAAAEFDETTVAPSKQEMCALSVFCHDFSMVI